MARSVRCSMQREQMIVYLNKQEGQDGPGSLTWIFEITIAYVFFWGIETKFIILLSNFQKVTCKVHFEIWPSVSKGRIFKNSSFLYKNKYPPSTRAMFLSGSKFTNKFSKGSPKEHFGIFFLNLTSGFREREFSRISSCPYSASSSHSQEQGSPKEHPCQIILKSDQGFQRRRIFKNFFISI